MRIALDWDETVTKDPLMWIEFIKMVQDHGHEVMIVTFRDPGLPVEFDPGIHVYYTSYKAKRRYMKDQGIDIDVWIDDSPECITGDSSWTDEERERWKKENGK